MEPLQLFEECAQRKIKAKLEYSHFPNRKYVGSPFLRLTDTTEKGRDTEVNFDLEGRLLSIIIWGGECAKSRWVKLMERSYNGTFYVNAKNLVNITQGHNRADVKDYDLPDEAFCIDDKAAKSMVDSVTLLLSQLSRNFYRTNGSMEIRYSDCSCGSGAEVESMGEIIPILQKAEYTYNWQGLVRNALFHSAYPSPPTVMPPDLRPDQNLCYTVLQITEGCQKRKSCGFCNSYQGTPYREKPEAEVREHIQKVKEFHGGGFHYVMAAFLSDADPLGTKTIDPAANFKIFKEELPQIEEFETFISTQTILSRSKEEWRHLRDSLDKSGQFLHVHWGVESADDWTLRIIGKPHNQKMLYEAAKRLKDARISYGIIIMSGLEALDNPNRTKLDNMWGNHQSETRRFIEFADPPTIYISKFKPLPGTQVHEKVMRGELHPCSSEELRIQHHEMADGARLSGGSARWSEGLKFKYGGQFL